MKKQKVIDKLKEQPIFPLRHSAEHVMHMAVESLFPGAKKVMGPPIEDGFYGDFDYEGKITEEDFPKIEQRMRDIVEANLPIVMRDASFEELKEIFKDNPFKLEMIEEIEKDGGNPTACEIGERGGKFYDIDLCAGNHTGRTSNIGAFKLLGVAGAYWRGDEKNKMLTRIYATNFETQKELDDYLEMVEKAKERDHRKLGKELELFMMDEEVGQGLPIWLPNGAFVRHKAMEFAFNTYLERGYLPVTTPHIASEALWSHSGHLNFYKDAMYNSFGIEEESYRLKPMNCPMHIKVYSHKPRSYKELPFRTTEMGTVYRYEKSGVLQGLTRVRGFTQDDGHIMCTEEQLHDELMEAMDLTMYVLKTFGFNEFEVNLSVRDPDNKEKYIGEDKDWDKAEEGLRLVLKNFGFENYVTDVGGAVFYGPKIDIKVSDAIGRKWQLSTIQVDFNLPGKFNMFYIDKEGNQKVPFMIHRALLGSLERFMGVFIEHTNGAFPVWMCPIQVQIIPIGDKHVDYAKKISEQLKERNIRSVIDDRSETMQSKIRDAQMKKIPYMFIIGDKEVENNQVSVRLRTEENLGPKPLNEVIERIEKMYLTKSLNLW